MSRLVRDLSASARIGVARRDITPPVGIYNRAWGGRPITMRHKAFTGRLLRRRLRLPAADLGLMAV